MEMKKILDYLFALEAHNDPAFYHAHKPEYQEACKIFEDFLSSLMDKLTLQGDELPPVSPKELTFKLNRDVRFSHDKSPYNPSFRAHIGPKGKLPIPVGYYIMIKPGGGSFIGGGLFAPMFKDATEMIRGYLCTHSDEWQQIITSPDFTKYFTVMGEALKNVPRGYDPAHPQAEYLKNKSWYLEYHLSDEQILADDFLSFTAGLCAAMRPFNQFLNEALRDFVMPMR
ncbi:MAG: DUF2461 domain-containing protein [Oscillospiraceae bacterium]|nr:DUF2461 domain-containing protein [Oscillospiraceae bacterium]